MPRSLAGQMALLLGLALLFAQLANLALILTERQKLSLARNEGPAIARFVNVAADFRQAPAEFRLLVLEDNSRRGARFFVGLPSAVSSAALRNGSVERRLAGALGDAGVPASAVRAEETSEPRPPRSGNGRARPDARILILSAELAPGLWLNGRMTTPRPDPLLTLRLGAGTLLLYLIVLGATVLIAARIARPLRDLAQAADLFGGRGTPVEVEPRGPADVRRALEAFNAMNRRVVALLDEKDRMLGAIGHDLRTPLASLRIRIESIDNDPERARAVATIEEMTAMLEDILVLARSGRAREATRTLDVTALADALVEEYRERGQDVALGDGPRLIAQVQPNLLRRALRNLIENALRYGHEARLRLREEGGSVVIEVSDRGPGLSSDQLERVLEPFYRGEESRNRDTGGSGLGLPIAKAIAEGHGGELRLANGPGGGLVAKILLPASAPD